MKQLLFLFLLFFLCSEAFCQETNYWNILKDVEIKTKRDKTGKYEIEYPEFGENLRSIDGKIIQLKGYIVPLKELTGQKFFVLSAYPFNMCFFCGMAGPETVIEVNSVKEIGFTSDKITVEGRLKLNFDDANHLMYILDDAKHID